MNLPPPPAPQHDDPIITQFKPVQDQWELNDDSIKLIDPETGNTILHNYCKCINTTPVEVYRYLIETKGCDVNAQDKSKDTLLHWAVRYFNPNKGGEINVLTYLINQKNVNVNIKGKSGNTLLHTACQRINDLPLDIFKVLIETHGFDVNAQNDFKMTSLRIALYHFDPHLGGITVLMYLLSRKDVNVNINSGYNNTLLHEACQRINKLPLDVFKFLIGTRGCDMNVRNNNKNTPLHNALLLFDQNKGGEINVLTYLLSQKGVNANIKGDNGYSLLHLASQKINKFPLEIFKLLIETHGADLDTQDGDKNTPIHSALDYFNPNDGGDINVLVYLINQKNIDLNTKYKRDYTLLHTTCMINLSNLWYPAQLNAEYDTILSQIVEVIVERCIEEVLDEINLK